MDIKHPETRERLSDDGEEGERREEERGRWRKIGEEGGRKRGEKRGREERREEERREEEEESISCDLCEKRARSPLSSSAVRVNTPLLTLTGLNLLRHTA